MDPFFWQKLIFIDFQHEECNNTVSVISLIWLTSCQHEQMIQALPSLQKKKINEEHEEGTSLLFSIQSFPSRAVKVVPPSHNQTLGIMIDHD